MYTQSFLTTSDLGIGPLPTTGAKSSLIFIGFMNAELAFAMLLLKIITATFVNELYQIKRIVSMSLWISADFEGLDEVFG